MSLKMIITICAVAFMLIFVFQNMEVVRVQLLIWSIEASRVLIYLVLFLVGFFTGWATRSLRGRR